MARTVTLTFEDGSTHVYQNVPDNVTPDAIQQRAAVEFQGKALRGIDGGKGATPADVSLGMTGAGAAIAPIADAALSLATGAVATPVAGIAGMVAAPFGKGKEVVEGVQQAMTYQPRTAGGRAITDTIAYPFEKLAQGADAAGGVVTDMATRAGLPPAAAAALGAQTNAGIAVGVPTALSGGAARMSPIRGGIKPEARTAFDRDYAMTPEDMGAGPIAKSIATLAGEPKLARSISRANEDVHMKYIASDLGLPPDTPVTPKDTARIRKEAGQVYEKARNMGRVQMDGEYFSDIAKLYGDYAKAEIDFPGSKSPVMDLADKIRVSDASADGIVSKINTLRSDADAAFGRGDRQLGKASKDAAAALERMLVRHAEKTGQSSSVVKEMREARERIAKTYAADDAINPGTGRVDSQVYASRRRDNKPLSGGGGIIGDTAMQFPRSNMRPSIVPSASGGPTIADAILSMAGGGKSLSLDLISLLARPVARAALESRAGQAAMLNTPELLDAIRRGQALPAVGVTESAIGQR